MPKSLVTNHFDYAGIYVEGKRSVFRFHKPVLTSGMSGMLIPMGDPIPVFPGTKLDLKADMVIRSNTMIVPPLDGIYIDVFAVWVPTRIVWSHMPQFLGENDTTAWTQSSTYEYPNVPFHNIAVRGLITDTNIVGDVVAGNLSLSTHYGLGYKESISSSNPIYNQKINVIPYRGYYAIWNHLFRDENYQRPVLFAKSDNGTDGEFGYLLRDYKMSSTLTATQYWTSNPLGTGFGYNSPILMPVNKLHDAYTSFLPAPQFGNAVELPLGDSAPFVFTGPTTPSAGTLDAQFLYLTGASGSLTIGATSGSNFYPAKVDLSNATAATINQLRSSVMYQRFLEALARGGRRVPEYYESIYGVKNSAVLKDYPEMLSHSRYMLGVNQVVATADSSNGNWTSHLGDTGAYSLTNLRNIPLCEKDFTEFGYLHLLYCVRADNRFSQSVPAHFFKTSLMDEYNPYFDHIGDVAVPNYQVNLAAASAGNFGYQEAWFTERTQIPMATGALNKSYGSLSFWTVGEVLDQSLTTCTPGYLAFDPGVFDDIFVSAYYSYPQFIFDSLIHGKKTARMSQHSIPGIVGRI